MKDKIYNFYNNKLYAINYRDQGICKHFKTNSKEILCIFKLK